MSKENVSQEFILKNIDETRNYFYEKTEQSDLVSRKHKQVCITLIYIEHLLIFASVISIGILISVFAFSLGIPIGITSSAIGLKICVKVAGIRKYKW